MNNIFDSHVHSDNSSDASHSITFLCERAVELGIRGLCITDHCELRDYGVEQYEKRIQQSVFGATMARQSFSDRLTVMAGIELSDVLYDRALTAQVLAAFPLDFVLVSQHTMPDGVDFFFKDFKELTQQEIHQELAGYFNYLFRVTEWGGYDALAHLTYPLRYITGRDGIPVDIRKFDDIIEHILKNLAASGKALEINTSGIGGELNDTMPPARYIKRFRELGGEYITLGSDAHSVEALGHGIKEGMRLLTEAGCEYYTLYKERQPVQFAIESKQEETR